MFHNYDTEEHAKGLTFLERKLLDRYQADYDYHGKTDAETDEADLYESIRCVRVG